MSDKISDKVFDIPPKKPNFGLIVVLSGITLLVLFLGAFLLLSDTGRKLLPGLHPDAHPNSYLLPAPTGVVSS